MTKSPGQFAYRAPRDIDWTELANRFRALCPSFDMFPRQKPYDDIWETLTDELLCVEFIATFNTMHLHISALSYLDFNTDNALIERAWQHFLEHSIRKPNEIDGFDKDPMLAKSYDEWVNANHKMFFELADDETHNKFHKLLDEFDVDVQDAGHGGPLEINLDELPELLRSIVRDEYHA